MSHTPMNQNIPNGMVSHQWTPGKSASLIQQNVPQNYSGSSINGLQNSTHSSRDPSPHTWKYQPSALNQIPASQLPPGMKSNMSQGKISTNSSNPVDKTVDVKLMNSQKQNANILLSQVQDTPKNILLAPMNVNSMAPSLVTNLHNSSSVQLLGPLPQTSLSENISSKTNNQSSHGSFQASSLSTGSISSSKINNINSEHQNKVQSSSLVSPRNDKFVSKTSPMQSNTIEPIMQQIKQVSLEASDNSVNQNQNLSTGVLNNSNLIQQVSTVSPKIASVSQVDSNKSFISNKSQNSLSDRSSKIFVSAQDSVLKPSIIASTPNLSTPHSQNNNLSSHSMTNVNSAVSPQANSTIGVQGKIIPNYMSGGLQSSSGVSNVFQSATGIATHNFDQKQNLPAAPPIGTTATPPPNIQWFPHSNSPQLQPNYPNMQTRPEFVASDVRQYSGMQNTDEQVGRVLNLNQPQSASISNLSQPPPYSKSNQQFVSNVPLNQSNQRIEGHSGLTQKQVSTMSQPREQTLNSNQQPHSSMQQPTGQAVNVNNKMQLPESIQGLSVPPSLNNQQFGSSQIQTINKPQIQQQQTLNQTQNVSSLLTHNQSISDKQKPSGFSSDSINNSNQSQQFNLNASQLIKPPMSCASTVSSGHLDNKPPIMQPPMAQPSMVQPSMVQPPMVQPPMVQPSMVQPPIMQPSMVQPPSGYQNISNNPPVLTSTNQFSATHNSPIGKRYPTKMPSYDNQQMNANQMPQFQDFSTNSANSMRYQRNDKFQTNHEFYVQQSQGNAAQPAFQQQANYNQYGQLNVTQSGFNRLWGHESVDLLQNRNILPSEKIEAPSVCLVQECLNAANCSPDIFRCTMTKIPESSSLLNKSRLPLGVLIHPFRDLNHLPVIQCSSIVRCRSCRTYINPFVYFVDTKRWKCNLCYRVNELPEEFQYDPVSKSYGDPSRRPEIKSSTIEYIAPSEYMLRPPQPAIYLFVLDISRLAIESGYLQILCNTLADELDNLPGDSRTQVGFLCFNSALHFYSLADGLNQPHEMTVVDIDDVFLPCPDNLLVNLKERKELIKDLLSQLPTRFVNSHDNGSALGAALQAAFKMISPTGGRVTVFQCTLPTIGPGALTSREVPSQRSNSEVAHLNPATDFYKRLALDCSAHQVAVDLFVLNSQYVDLSTISGISRFSAGCMHHWPLFKASRIVQAQQFYYCLRRYLTRKIGYEAVMRIRCTRGLSIHTFHGNFFVRSTDLLSLPNCNPDSGFGMQVSIEENLSDLQTVCFQAALLYTSSKGERRIRVHTLCLPVVATLTEVLNSADEQCIIGILAKMAVDRSFQSSLADARDAFINAVIDILSAYKLSLNQGSVGSGLLASHSLKLLPLYIVALLKYTAFRTGTSTRLDDRVFAMCEMKTLPLTQLIQQIYPDLYPVHCLTEDGGIPTEDGRIIPQPSRLQLSAEKLDSRGAFLLDCGQHMMLYIGHNVAVEFLNSTLGYPHFEAIPDECYELPKTSTPENDRLHLFISSLNDEKPYPATIQILRDNSPFRIQFTEKLIEDRIENALSYYEFLQHLKTHVK